MTNIISRVLIVSTVGLLFTSCGLYTKYQRSAEIAPADSLYTFIEATNDTTSFASMPWRELFTDPYLEALVERALENNSDLNLAREGVVQAEAILKSARLAYLPSLNVTPQGAISSFGGNSTKTYNLSLASSWELDVFGRLTNAKEASKARLEASRAYRQAVQTQLIATVATTYYQLLLNDEQIAISEVTLANWSDNVRVLEALKRAGRSNEIAVSQASANRVALQAELVTLKKVQSDLLSALASLLGSAPEDIERGVLADFTAPELSTGLPIALLSNRPDVRMAEYTLAEKFYATGEARSSLYPQITITGLVGFTNSGGGGITNPGDMLYNAVASLVQPIFNRGALKAQLKVSESQQEQALISFKQSILDAAIEVNDAVVQIESSSDRIKLAEERIGQLERAVSASELLMRHSSGSYLEVLLAKNSLLQAEFALSNDIFEEISAVIALYRSLGGGERKI